MKRKTFIQKTLGAMLIGIPVLSVAACSSDSGDDPNNDPDPNPDPTGQPNCSANGAFASSISANHGHDLTVSRVDIDEASPKTYSIQGSSGHDHMVTLTADDFQTLQTNDSISVVSTSGGGHTHSVTVSCA